MSKEVHPSASRSLQEDFGSLRSCLVDGSPEQRARERRIRRRALVISVAAQSAILTAIILLPLFGKPERLTYASTPIPPSFLSKAPAHPRSPNRPATGPHRPNFYDRFSPPTQIPRTVSADPDPGLPEPPGFPSAPGSGAICADCIPIDDGRAQPARPAEIRSQPPKRISVTRLEPAMLIHRVEPVYPPLARQIRLDGQVELRAIIATDGTIQSLQVVTGPPLLLQSALDAVRQWRYRPTILNGQPVEIDTFITVIYNLQH